MYVKFVLQENLVMNLCIQIVIPHLIVQIVQVVVMVVELVVLIHSVQVLVLRAITAQQMCMSSFFFVVLLY